jgi:hypothetical protein
MKIKLIRGDSGVAHHIDRTAFADDIVTINGAPFWKSGTVLDVNRRGAQLLVGNGDAEPADAEAEDACSGWKTNRDTVLLAREMLAKAIDPEDRDRFRNGEILGYDADGNDIPGPHWKDNEGEDDDEGDSDG